MTEAPKRRFPAGLGLRLGLMTLLALLPLGILSLGQTRSIVEQAEESQILAAMGETVKTAMPEILVIGNARTLAQIVGAAVVPAISDTAACNRLLTDIGKGQPMVSLLAFVPLSGQMDCATSGAGRDLRGNPTFQTLIAARDPMLLISAMGSISGTSVVLVTQPVFDATGGYLGYVSISVPHEALIAEQQSLSAEQDGTLIALMTFESTGTLLTSSTGMAAAARHLPQGQPLAELAKRGERAFFATGQDGARLLYTVVPIAGSLFLLGVWQAENPGMMTGIGPQAFVFPLLMWLAGLAVAILGSERLVTRHVRRLSRAMHSFTFGERNQPEITLDDPPAEIASLAGAYRTMTATILRDEAELQNLLRQKEELLREVHHRTGNSLQLIASILRMHRREAKDEGVLSLLDHLHDRVMSLSTVHLGLYRIAGRNDVAVNALMSEVIAKVGAIHGRAGRRDLIEADLQPLILTAQQAVPLALLLAEVLSSFPVSDMDPGAPPVRIRLETLEENRARLVVAGPVAARGILVGEHEGAPAVIAARLIRSFVAQLDGEMAVGAEGPQVTATITFRVRAPALPEPSVPPQPAAA